MGRFKKPTKRISEHTDASNAEACLEAIEVQLNNIKEYKQHLDNSYRAEENLIEQLEKNQELLEIQKGFVEYFETDKDAFRTVNEANALYKHQTSNKFRELAHKVELLNRNSAVTNTENLLEKIEENIEKTLEFRKQQQGYVQEAEDKIKKEQLMLEGLGHEFDLDAMRTEILGD